MDKRFLSFLACVAAASCGDDNPSTMATPTTTSAPPVQIEEFTLTARDCFFSRSRVITTLGPNQSFTIRFSPQQINGDETSEWVHSVQFWLGDQDADDSLGLNFLWNPNSQWDVAFFVPEGLFGTGRTELLDVGGRLREITYVRSEGLVEWLLDGVVILQLRDDRTGALPVRTTVVGAEALFLYEATGASTLRASSDDASDAECMSGSKLCAFAAR